MQAPPSRIPPDTEAKKLSFKAQEFLLGSLLRESRAIPYATIQARIGLCPVGGLDRRVLPPQIRTCPHEPHGAPLRDGGAGTYCPPPSSGRNRCGVSSRQFASHG